MTTRTARVMRLLTARIDRLARQAGTARGIALVTLLPVVALGALAGLGTALRRPLWLDEILSYLVATDARRGVIGGMKVGIDFQPPMHYALVHVANAVTTSPAIAARLPSLIAALCAVVIVALILRRTVSLPAALAGAFCLAAHPLFATQAVEGRPYALWILASALLAGSLSSSVSMAWALLAAAFAVNAHYFGILSVAAIGTVVGLCSWWTRRTVTDGFRRSVLVLVTGGLTLLLLIPMARAQLMASGGRSWVPAPTAKEIFVFLRYAWGWHPALQLVLAGVAALVFRRLGWLAPRAPVRSFHDLPTIGLLATAAVPVLIVLISVTYKPVLVLRYSVPALLAVATLCAIATDQLPRPLRWLALLLLFRGMDLSYRSLADQGRQASGTLAREARSVAQLARAGIPTVAPSRHAAYELAFLDPPAGQVSWIVASDSVIERITAHEPPEAREARYVERAFGLAVERGYQFPSTRSIESVRRLPTVALLHFSAGEVDDTLWLPGFRRRCAIGDRLVVYDGPASTATRDSAYFRGRSCGMSYESEKISR